MSSSLYSPDPEAIQGGIDYIKILSERDLSSQIPVNFVSVPGVSLTAACFHNGRYASSSAAKCFSNLLASGFRRLDIDLYWDVSRSTWSFCPVELGDAHSGLSSTQDNTESPTPAATASLASGRLSTGSSNAETDPPGLRARQTLADGSSVLAASTVSLQLGSELPAASATATLSTSGTVTSLVGPAQPTSQLANGETLISIGQYQCSPSLNFRTFLNVLNPHLDNTEDNLNATTKILTLNLHSAKLASDPDGAGPAPQQASLPRNNNLLSNLFSANSSQYLYTPANLQEQRADLNQSDNWFGVRREYVPDASYFTVESAGSYSYTPDGWPSESYVEFAKAKRLFAGFGRIDPQMSAYNFSADASTIFPSGYLEADRTVSVADSGHVVSGCVFQAGVTSLTNVNSSFALASVTNVGNSEDARLYEAGNLTVCGISPVLNTTLQNTTADANPQAYREYFLESVWSWAPNEPRDETDNDEDRDSSSANRCAVLNATSGRWQTDDCSDSHHSACRVGNQPYNFQISDDQASYMKSGAACPDDTSFAVPRTALENSYLVSAWTSFRSRYDINDELLFVDLNDLNAASCWVVGQNATCPYQNQSGTDDRAVVVPTVAAVIVFVLTLALIFVKCAANRQNTRRKRRRGDEGWDYEGVPS